jgi:hypothetical protein
METAGETLALRKYLLNILLKKSSKNDIFDTLVENLDLDNTLAEEKEA